MGEDEEETRELTAEDIYKARGDVSRSPIVPNYSGPLYTEEELKEEYTYEQMAFFDKFLNVARNNE